MAEHERDDVVALLRARDRELSKVPLSFGADLRIRKALRDGTSRRPPRSRLVAGLAVGLAGLVALVAVLVVWPARELPAERGAHDACSVREHGPMSELSGRCTLQLGRVTLQSTRQAAVESRPNELAVLRGHVRLKVAPVAPKQPPVRVRVSGGVIEVVGTEFAITEDGTTGTVELFEGKIRFLAPGRAVIELRPGERFSWKASAPAEAEELPPRAPSTTEQSAPVPPPSRPAAPAPEKSAAQRPEPRNVDHAVERALELRAQGRYDEARAEIDAVDGSADQRAAEALSYERASLLWRGGDAAGACAQWRAHAVRFPQGSYHSFVTKHLSERCSQPATGN
ncbi:MAG TPA: FecR family protein [Polyangiaceae bacterium]|nr:FecR family protein [Polyangiaceae bacterium]